MSDNDKPTAPNRTRAIALWARDTGLGTFGYLLVLGVALSGWSASFIGLHDFGVRHMSLSDAAAWLVPATFDGAPAGLSIVVMRASLAGRSAVTWRILIVGFTALSSWINYHHIPDLTGREIAALMPPSAVILFEALMSEARISARPGRPRLHPLRWVFDPKGTWALLREFVLALPLPEALSVAVAEALPVTPSERSAVAAVPAMEAPQSTATERPAATPQSALAGATEAPRNRPQGAPADAPKAPRKTPSKRPKNDVRGAARDVIKALYDTHGKRPVESQMIAALKAARLPSSRQFANARRLEIEKEHPDLAALGQDNVVSMTGTDG